MREIRIVSAEQLTAHEQLTDTMLAIADEDSHLPELPDFPDSRSLLEKGNGKLGVVRAWEEPEPGPRDWVIEGLVPKGHPTGMFGDGGTGKSYCALHIAACV